MKVEYGSFPDRSKRAEYIARRFGGRLQGKVLYDQYNALRHNLSNVSHCVILCLTVARVRRLVFRNLRA